MNVLCQALLSSVLRRNRFAKQISLFPILCHALTVWCLAIQGFTHPPNTAHLVEHWNGFLPYTAFTPA